MFNLVKTVSATSSVNNKRRINHSLLNKAAQIEVLRTFSAEPISPLRSVAAGTEMSQVAVTKPLKIHKYQTLDAEVHDDIYETSCLQIYDITNRLLNNCFSDECCSS